MAYQMQSGSCRLRPSGLRWKMLASAAAVHSARGLPLVRRGAEEASYSDGRRICVVVMSRGNRVRSRRFGREAGYAPGVGRDDAGRLANCGGMVDAGRGDVRARTRAKATASACVLNSARGVIWMVLISWILGEAAVEDLRFREH